jgi:hypothetical protein
MPTELTESEKQLLGDVVKFAQRRCQGSVYFNRLLERTTGTPVILLIAFGEQAEALDQLINSARVREAVEIFKTEDLSQLNGAGGH